MTNSEKPLRFLSSKSAAVISLALCLPFLFLYITAVNDLEPYIPFIPWLALDGLGSTTLGRIVMIGMLVSLPVAFLINLLPMVTKAGSERAAPFRLTPAHAIIGVSILFVVLVTWAEVVLYELRPFVTPLGSGSTLGQILFFLGLLALPVAFLLNFRPRIAKAGSGGALAFQPNSINLIIGAAILLVILMIASSFMLEEIACSIGVPNCD